MAPWSHTWHHEVQVVPLSGYPAGYQLRCKWLVTPSTCPCQGLCSQPSNNCVDGLHWCVFRNVLPHCLENFEKRRRCLALPAKSFPKWRRQITSSVRCAHFPERQMPPVVVGGITEATRRRRWFLSGWNYASVLPATDLTALDFPRHSFLVSEWGCELLCKKICIFNVE